MLYALDGTDPKTKGMPYTQPFGIREATLCVRYPKMRRVFLGRKPSTVAPFPHPERKVTLFSAYIPHYAAGGADGLIDSIRGDEAWRKGAGEATKTPILTQR